MHELAVGSNQAAVNELRNLDKKGNEKKLDDQNYIQKLLDSKSSQSASNSKLADLVSKLAGSGVKLSAESFVSKAQNKLKDEYESVFKTKDDSTDAVEIKSSSQKISSIKKFSNKQGDGQENGKPQVSEYQKMTKTVSEFSGAYAEYLVSGGTDLKKKVERLENQLKSEGFTDSQILSFKQSIKQSMRGQIAGQIKESVLKRFLSTEQTIEWVMHNNEAFKSINFAFNNEKLGGWDFGGYNDHLQGTVDRQMDEAKSQVRDFVNDQLKTSLVKKSLGVESAGKEIKELIKMGMKSGLDPDEFLANWNKVKDNLGLIPLPPEAQIKSSMGFSDQSKKEETGYEYSAEEEKDLFINQLRMLYMKRALNGDYKTQLETSFKMRKLKNGLIKLGINFANFEKIEKEGKNLARVNVLEMLKDAFAERASFYELGGPAFQLNEKKLKGLYNNLTRLGVELSKYDIDSLRDQANHKMFDVARSEFEKAIMLFKDTKNPQVEKKIFLIVKLLKRLKEESMIATEFDPDLRFYAVSSAA